MQKSAVYQKHFDNIKPYKVSCRTAEMNLKVSASYNLTNCVTENNFSKNKYYFKKLEFKQMRCDKRETIYIDQTDYAPA